MSITCTTMTHSKRVETFIAALEELTRKTGLKIEACGCCQSPWLVTLSRKEKGKKYGYEYDFKGLQYTDKPEIICERLSWDMPLPPLPRIVPAAPTVAIPTSISRPLARSRPVIVLSASSFRVSSPSVNQSDLEGPAPLTDADTVRDRAVYDAWRAKQS